MAIGVDGSLESQSAFVHHVGEVPPHAGVLLKPHTGCLKVNSKLLLWVVEDAYSLFRAADIDDKVVELANGTNPVPDLEL